VRRKGRGEDQIHVTRRLKKRYWYDCTQAWASARAGSIGGGRGQIRVEGVVVGGIAGHVPLCPLPPAPCTLHPAPCTLHPAPCTLHPAPCTLHPAPCTLHPAPCLPYPMLLLVFCVCLCITWYLYLHIIMIGNRFETSTTSSACGGSCGEFGRRSNVICVYIYVDRCRYM
jgi:hypothetical protein